MSTLENKFKVLVVIDPSDDQPVALERLINTNIGKDKDQIEVCIFVGVDSESTNMRVTNDNLCRDQTWYAEHIEKPLAEAKIKHHSVLSWSTDWQASIVQEAKRFGADTIYLPVHKRTNVSRFTFSESKWDLFKTANCPVVLIRPESRDRREVILAAVNFQAYKPHQIELNASIIKRAQFAASMYNAELHIVNGYLDSMHYPDRGKLVRETGVESDKIHVKQGYTSDVVAQVAKEIKADMVIIGTLGQTGKEKTRRGHTAERVIASLDVDTAVINN